jgi:hypothetical protein
VGSKLDRIIEVGELSVPRRVAQEFEVQTGRSEHGRSHKRVSGACRERDISKSPPSADDFAGQDLFYLYFKLDSARGSVGKRRLPTNYSWAHECGKSLTSLYLGFLRS